MSLTGLVRAGISRRTPAQMSPPCGRSAVSAAMETIALVLDDNVVVPATVQDAHDLLNRLRDHHGQLGQVAGARGPAPLTVHVTEVLCTSGALIARPLPGGLVRGADHVRSAAGAVKGLLTAMCEAGLTCIHQPECPSAAAPDFQAARVVLQYPETGYSRLCNGIVLFDDTGYLKPDGVCGPPR
ncbi:DUF5999 family protein [Streptomyces scopuliridis]|uniref:DUF5999 family protein n=1 Tax=Streptomyces scopuliridis TaxID=452529 RepID=UPI00367A92FF